MEDRGCSEDDNKKQLVAVIQTKGNFATFHVNLQVFFNATFRELSDALLEYELLYSKLETVRATQILY